MTVGAVIFDVYQTLLDVGPPPTDATAGWEKLWRQTLGVPPPLSLQDFAAACEREIAREHEAARAAGIAFPEVFWPGIATAAAPDLGTLSAAALDTFLFRHAQLVRRVNLGAETAALLRALAQRGLWLGLASNSQSYTVHELSAALAGAGLSLGLFERDLCFWSFEHGFSKPDPHVFRLLSARLRARGITPAQTLMVGDRLDNDIAPARRAGWQAWQLNARDAGPSDGGSWAELRDALGLAASGGRERDG